MHSISEQSASLKQSSKKTALPIWLKAVLLALCASLLWAGNFVAARAMAGETYPIAMSFWRWSVALVVILPMGGRELWSKRGMLWPHRYGLLAMGLLGVGSYNTLIYIAGHSTSAHNIALIATLAPIWTLLIAWLWRLDVVDLPVCLGAGLAAIAAVVLLTHGHIEALLHLALNKGDVIVFAASILWAIYCVLLRFRPPMLRGSSFLLCIVLIGWVGLLPFFAWEALSVGLAPLTLKVAAAYVYMGVAASVIAWSCWNSAIALIGPVRTGLFYYTISLFSSVIAVFWPGEPFKSYHALAMGLMVLAVVLANLRFIRGWWRMRA